MKKNKGFTLVELLAVFVILAIIASIAIFSVINIKKASAKSIYIESIKNLITSTSQYYGENNYTDFPSEGMAVKDLKVDNKNQFTSGIVKLVNNDFIVIDISNGEYCANGKIDSLTITDGDCS